MDKCYIHRHKNSYKLRNKTKISVADVGTSVTGKKLSVINIGL